LKASLRTKLDSLAKRLEDLNRLLSAENAARDMDEFRKAVARALRTERRDRARRPLPAG
jgi:hypothetical protein